MEPPRKRARNDTSDESDEEQLESIHPEDVTIAIFCALVEETAAVQETLDEELACSSKMTGKAKYVYSFGRIGDHNIVIAQPVIQYDFGKYESDGKFVQKGTMDKPPPILSSAIRSLEVDEFRNKAPIRRLLRRLIRQQPKFARPENGDVLYDVAFAHKEPGSDCNACQLASDAKVVDRSPRSTATLDQPYIHRGLILSGSGVIKSPEDRERLRRGYQDAICFEMEAAGIMNEIPCLVIRGICDYADTHKQDGWHNYAAATAAAYCKAVLLKVPGDEVTGTAPMRENIQNNVEVLKHDVDLEKIRRWLSPPDPSTNFNRARELHHERTGDWLIKGEMYSAWKQEANSCIWLNGIAGCGKTILSSSVLADLKQGPTISQSLVYFYFDFNDTEKQSHEQALRSLISQLYDKRKRLRETVDTLYSTCSFGGHQPSLSSLCTIFQDMIQQAEEVWIVLDALDECPKRNDESAGGLLSWIHRLRHAGLNIHLLVTSRPEQDIKAAIEKFKYAPQIINLQSDLVKNDINAYIRTRTREMERWKTHPGVQREIEVALIEKADGMFRWAACQFDILNRCLDRQSIRRQLNDLPRTLSDTYTRILHGIEIEYRHHTNRLLRFLLYSKYPLSLDQVVDALAVDTTEHRHARFHRINRMPIPEDILRCCSSLVVLYRARDIHEENPVFPNSTEKNTYVRLAHFSVQEYLLSDPTMAEHLNEITSRTEIVQVCLSYLFSICHIYMQGGEFARGEDENVNDSMWKIHNWYPFSYYSARNWAEQAKIIELSENATLPLVTEFFSDREAVKFSSWIYPPDDHGNGLFPYNIDALYYASCTRLVHSARVLLDNGAPVNAPSECWYNPLHAASMKGHEPMVKLLLDRGAAIDTDNGSGTALDLAIRYQRESIVELLLARGANTELDSDKGTHLCCAIRYGKFSIAKILLAQGAKITGDVLRCAARWGNIDFIHLLFDESTDLETQDDMGRTPLRTAIDWSYSVPTKVLELLVQLGANVNTADNDGETPLMVVARRGRADLVQLLLRHGADIYLMNAMGQTAVDYAVASENEAEKTLGHRRWRNTDFRSIKALLGTPFDQAIASERG
ncbi:hypothetical protein PG984_014078 [Apiospora sp. TS-2023a]